MTRLILAAAACALIAVPAAASARSSTLLTVRAPTELRLKNTNIYCAVGTTRSGPAVECARFPHGLGHAPQGLAIESSDTVVGVENAVTSKTVRAARNEKTLSALVGVITGGQSYPNVVTLGLQQDVLVSGSRMIVLVDPAKGGGNAIGVLFLDSQGRPVPGTYSVGISNHSVTMIQVGVTGTPRVVYEHAVG